MNKVLHVLERILTYLEEGIIVIGLAAMAILNFANVISRYFLHSSISYTEEVIIFLFLWVTMMGISAGYKRHAHLGISLITDHLKGVAKKTAALIALGCSLILIGLIIYYGFEMVGSQMRFGGRTTALRMPTWWQGLSIPCGGILMGIRAVQCTVREWKEDDAAKVSAAADSGRKEAQT